MLNVNITVRVGLFYLRVSLFYLRLVLVACGGLFCLRLKFGLVFLLTVEIRFGLFFLRWKIRFDLFYLRFPLSRKLGLVFFAYGSPIVSKKDEP